MHNDIARKSVFRCKGVRGKYGDQGLSYQDTTKTRFGLYVAARRVAACRVAGRQWGFGFGVPLRIHSACACITLRDPDCLGYVYGIHAGQSHSANVNNCQASLCADPGHRDRPPNPSQPDVTIPNHRSPPITPTRSGAPAAVAHRPGTHTRPQVTTEAAEAGRVAGAEHAGVGVAHARQTVVHHPRPRRPEDPSACACITLRDPDCHVRAHVHDMRILRLKAFKAYFRGSTAPPTRWDAATPRW